eukprot:646498-Prorocentrum_minimum.AAC.2
MRAECLVADAGLSLEKFLQAAARERVREGVLDRRVRIYWPEPGHRCFYPVRDQSEEGREDIPKAGTNRRRDGRIYPRRGPVGGGTGGFSRDRDLSEQRWEDIPEAQLNTG